MDNSIQKDASYFAEVANGRLLKMKSAGSAEECKGYEKAVHDFIDSFCSQYLGYQDIDATEFEKAVYQGVI